MIFLTRYSAGHFEAKFLILSSHFDFTAVRKIGQTCFDWTAAYFRKPSQAHAKGWAHRRPLFCTTTPRYATNNNKLSHDNTRKQAIHCVERAGNHNWHALYDRASVPTNIDQTAFKWRFVAAQPTHDNTVFFLLKKKWVVTDTMHAYCFHRIRSGTLVNRFLCVFCGGDFDKLEAGPFRRLLFLKREGTRAKLYRRFCRRMRQDRVW